MKRTWTITIEEDRFDNPRGTKEWGEFKIVSNADLNDKFVLSIIDQFRFGGETRFEKSKQLVGEIKTLECTYTGKFCWGD